jgi:hypothetical protein
MPTVPIIGPYRFFFYSADGDEPAHVHVERDSCEAKYWLNPVKLQSNRGFRRNELTKIYRLILKHQTLLLYHWHEYFGQ